MKHKSLQTISLILVLISLIMEVGYNQAWYEFNNPQALFGISLAMVLVSMSLNVKIIRTMGIQAHTRKTSLLALVVTAIYAVAVFGFELI